MNTNHSTPSTLNPPCCVCGSVFIQGPQSMLGLLSMDSSKKEKSSVYKKVPIFWHPEGEKLDLEDKLIPKELIGFTLLEFSRVHLDYLACQKSSSAGAEKIMRELYKETHLISEGKKPYCLIGSQRFDHIDEVLVGLDILINRREDLLTGDTNSLTWKILWGQFMRGTVVHGLDALLHTIPKSTGIEPLILMSSVIESIKRRLEAFPDPSIYDEKEIWKGKSSDSVKVMPFLSDAAALKNIIKLYPVAIILGLTHWSTVESHAINTGSSEVKWVKEVLDAHLLANYEPLQEFIKLQTKFNDPPSFLEPLKLNHLPSYEWGPIIFDWLKSKYENLVLEKAVLKEELGKNDTTNGIKVAKKSTI